MVAGRSIGWLVVLTLAVLLAIPTGTRAATPSLPVVGPGYTVRVFATGGTRYSHPTALATLNGLVYVGYANSTVGDGSDGGSSTVIAYTARGAPVQSYTIRGAISTLRADPRKGVVYATMNRLGNSLLAAISPAATGVRQIALPPNPPHGGGFGDVALVGDRLFASASNPTLNDTGANTAPALDRLTVAGSTATATPVLMGSGKATDVTTNQSVALNEVDPTTLAVTPAGDVLLVNEAGSEVVLVHRPASARPVITSLLTGTQVVEVAWTAAGKGRFLVADTGAGIIYTIEGTYGAGTPYAISAASSGVSALLGTLSLTTGTLKPFAFGFRDPAALLFTR